MWCKENINPSKSKHYTNIERKVFLQILERYKHIVEIKKSDTITLMDKKVAWTEICATYNESSLIAQERTTEQLKKLWSNLKQGQRDALTKERQARIATDGGPEVSQITIEPDISNITPHLMKIAPCQFTSNMTESCLNEKRDLAYELISTEQDTDVLQILDDNIENNICNDKVILSIDTVSADVNNTNINDNNKTSTLLETTAVIESNFRNIPEKIGKEKRNKKQRATVYEISNAEEKLRMERIKQVMKQEQQLADIKLQHEEKIAKIKENHLEEINQLELRNLKEIHNIQIQVNKTKLRILEHDLKIKENKKRIVDN